MHRPPPLAHYSRGTVAHFYFGANSVEEGPPARLPAWPELCKVHQPEPRLAWSQAP